MNVEEIPLKTIKVGERYRKDLGELDELVASIKERGVLVPIIVDTKFNLLAGGRRLEAAKQAGLKVVPVSITKIKGEIDPLEIELIENTLRKDFLWAERANLEKRIFDMKKAADPSWSQRDQAGVQEVSVGAVNRRLNLAEALEAFPELANLKTEDEAFKFMKKLEERIVVDELAKEAKANPSLKGVKIANTNYKVGNALDGMRALKTSQYHFAEVDPPYGVDLAVRKGRYSAGAKDIVKDYNELDWKEYEPFIRALAAETYRVLQPDALAVWWYGMSWHHSTLTMLREAGFIVSDIPAIWTKGNAGQTASPDTMLASVYEPFFVCRKGQAKFAKSGRANDFRFTPVAPSEKYHPTEKPLDLMVEILETFTYPGMRMVIPLLGSGVTLRACYKTGRVGFGWDLSEEYKKAFIAKVADEEMTAQLESK